MIIGARNRGACGSDCAVPAPDPAAVGVIPRCELRGGVAQCAFDCIEGTFDADGLSNNGCELTPDPNAVYVTTAENGGLDDANCGPFERPCATVANGLQRASALQRARVLVAEGVYEESITLIDGIDVLGGHQRTAWTRNPELFPSVLRGNGFGEPHRITVTARNITQPTRLDGFVIQGESPLLEGNAYAVYIVDSGPELTISNNRIFAGNGGRGVDGQNGASGQPGLNGSVGNPGFSQRQPNNCPANILNVGPAGGALV